MRRPAARVPEEARHQRELADQQGGDGRGVDGTPPGEEQRNDHDLRRRHDDAGEPRRAPGAELHGQRANAEPRVAGDRLKVVEGHDAVRAETVEERQQTIARSGRPAAMTAAPVNHGRPS